MPETSWLTDLEQRKRASAGPRPFVTVAFAISRDGCLTRTRGRATIISGPESQRLTHQLRARHDALLVGVGTVLSDDPALTTRLVEGPSPLRVVLDSQLRVPVTAKLLRSTSRAAWLVTQEPADAARARILRAAGAQIVQVPAADGCSACTTGLYGTAGLNTANLRSIAGAAGLDAAAALRSIAGAAGLDAAAALRSIADAAGTDGAAFHSIAGSAGFDAAALHSITGAAGLNSAPGLNAAADHGSPNTSNHPGVSIPALLSLLAASGVRSVMVEGGAAVLESFFRANAVDYVALTVSRRCLSNPCAVRLGDCTNAALDAWRAGCESISVGDDLLTAGPIDAAKPEPNRAERTQRLAAQ